MSYRKKVFITFIIFFIFITSVSGCGEAEANGQKYSCTIKISCNTVLQNIDLLDESKRQLIPEDGILLDDFTVDFYDGDTVFDILLSAVKANNIHMEYSTSPVFNTSYIEGIGNLYEFDCGGESGWKYSVNGTIPYVGISSQKVNDGDIIEMFYTLEASDF